MGLLTSTCERENLTSRHAKSLCNLLYCKYSQILSTKYYYVIKLCPKVQNQPMKGELNTFNLKDDNATIMGSDGVSND